MDVVNQLMNRTLIYYIVFILTMIAAIIFCVVSSRKKDSMAIYAIAIGIVLIAFCITSFVPFLKDYCTKGIIEVEAAYTNTLKDKSKSSSSIIGMSSVVLDTDYGRISLTTIPFAKDIFPQGEYQVNAWYTANSKWLVYIDIIEP